jgi:mannobiose 2-epimerase
MDNLGGFYREGTTEGKPESKDKDWWVEFEGLNALLMLHQRYGNESDVYFKAYQRQWSFLKNHQIDPEFHGVYPMVNEEGQPQAPVKGEIWKAAYHDGRALLNVSERLKRLATENQ